jgi:hypothetical protein
MATPRPQPRRDPMAVRCALVSTLALLGCLVAAGSLRAVLGLVWVVCAIAAMALEWRARRDR